MKPLFPGCSIGGDWRDHADRGVGAGLIHPTDAGSQGTSIASAELLCWKGLRRRSVVSAAYDNALAETTIGLFKTEAVGRGSPFLDGPLRTIDEVEYATIEWVDLYNNHRLHSQLEYVPPEEYEAAYYAHIQAGQPATPQP
jgi:putative transposase